MEAELARIFQVTNALVLVAMGVFTRVAAMMFLLPGLGERNFSARLRLGAALVLTFLMLPMIQTFESLSPPTPTALLVVLAAEAMVGLIIGLAFRLLIFALQIAGMVAAQHLSVAQMFGAGVAPEPEPTIATLLAIGGIMLMLMAGLHVHALATLVELYRVFPFGTFPDSGGLATWVVERMSETFALGVTLAAPFVAIGFSYNIALGALNRAMPQLLVALVGVPFLVWVGMVILYLVLPAIYDAWGAQMRQVFFDPMGGFR